MGMGVNKPQWSFSSIKLFEQCPKKYYHLKIKKDFKDEQHAAATYGEEFHEAAEHYVAGTAELPGHFEFARKALDKLKGMPGQKLCEYEMGLTQNLEPCAMSSPDVWWRGIADLIILNGDKAKVLDYKAGKTAKYADKDQLELMALAVFQHFPDVKEVDAALFFVVAKAFIRGKYSRKDRKALWSNWLGRYNRILIAKDKDVWNAKTSGLCKAYCVVLSCPHNGRND
jgi:ATP-dependent exoDNAse (exonuclease V) beta subunit